MSSFDDILQGLSRAHAAQFDPARFAFIQGLSKRLKAPQNSQNRALFNKLDISIKAFKKDMNAHKKRAQKIIKKVKDNFPAHLEHAERLFEQCEFQELKRFYANLEYKRRKECNSLSQLNALMNTRHDQDSSATQSSNLDDVLGQQDLQISAVRPDSELTSNTQEHIPLASVKLFRESMRHYKIDQIIEHAINSLPENPGPHNPHMLAIKAMTRMRELSPQYLRRLSGYVETLLWLEKNANRINESKNQS